MTRASRPCRARVARTVCGRGGRFINTFGHASFRLDSHTLYGEEADVCD